MAKNYFNRYVWLIDTIRFHGHITLEELSREWRRSAVNENGEPLAERTFHNHRIAIEDTFGIEIRSDRSLGYYIANGDDLEGDSIRRWLLESISLNNFMKETGDMRDRILFEEVPSCGRWLAPLVSALKGGTCVRITYKSFQRAKPTSFIVHPWCLKLFRQRWYLLALSDGKKTPYVYGLDRILDAKILETSASVPEDFDARTFFRNHYGIVVETGEKPTTVELKVDASQVKYFDFLPLHHSQEKASETPEFTVYQYRLIPTYDFRSEILSHGPDVEVLSPDWFREEVKDEIVRMNARYA